MVHTLHLRCQQIESMIVLFAHSLVRFGVREPYMPIQNDPVQISSA